MTYLQLLQRIQLMPTERLHDTVTAYDPYEDEYIAVIETDVCDEADNDQIEHNQLYLILKA
jgi:hypothetical protein